MSISYLERKEAAVANIAKLPKWAQTLIQDLQRERDSAIDELRRFEASKTPTRIWTESNPCTGETSGPTPVIRYLEEHVHWVHFKVGPAEYQQVDAGFNYPDGRFQIRSLGQMELLLDCANTVEVRVP